MTYEEFTAHTEETIKRLIDYSLKAKKEGDIGEWQAWRNQADGACRLWRDCFEDHPRKEADSDRLYDLIPCDDLAPAIEDHSALLSRIVMIVEDPRRWNNADMAAFWRGYIIGMCEKAGVRITEGDEP